jgi:hypothetical protein
MMFRQILATILLLTISAQTFSSPFIMFDYVVNTAEYAKNCVNKAKPKMNCKGKCQMMKKMREEERKEQQNPERKPENKDQVLSSIFFFFSVEPLAGAFYKAEAFELKYPLIDISYPFFHPPQM